MRKVEKVFIDVGIDDHLALVKIRYALDIIKNETIKIVILIVLFSVAGSMKEFLFAAIILFPLRFTSGGMHLKTNIGCFLFSLSFFVSTIWILPLIQTPFGLLFSLLIVSTIVIIVLSPIASYKRPIHTNSRLKTLRRNAIIFIIVDFLVLIILWRFGIYTYFVIGTWVVTLQAIQLLATWVYRKRKGGKNVTEDQGIEARISSDNDT